MKFNRCDLSHKINILIFMFCTMVVCKVIGLPQSNNQGDLERSLRESACLNREVTASQPIRVIRREDIDDQLFILRKQFPADSIRKPANFYEVRTNGIFLLPSNEVLIVSSEDGFQKWLIAISPIDNSSFGLAGCENAEEDFIKMVKQSGVEINNEEKAAQFARLRYMAVEDMDMLNLIQSTRDLRHNAENYYFDKYGAKLGNDKFKVWLQKYYKKIPIDATGTTVVKEKGIFRVTLSYQTAKDNTLLLKHVQMKISKNGKYELSYFGRSRIE